MADIAAAAGAGGGSTSTRMKASISNVDVLDVLRQTLVAAPPSNKAPLGSSVRLVDGSGRETDDVVAAASAQVGQHTIPLSTPTRLARSRNSLALSPTSHAIPANTPDSFFQLDAILLALQLASAQGGVYVVQATSKGLPRFEAVERNDILSYLLGRRSEWEGALSIQDIRQRHAETATTFGAAVGGEAGPSTTPPSSPPMALKQLHGQTVVKLPVKRPYVPSRADAAFVKRLRTSGMEIVLQNRNDAMHGSHPWTKTADFGPFRSMLASTIDAARKAASSGGSGGDGRSSTTSAAGYAGMPARKQRAQDPIIVLSNSPTTLVNMFNVKSLLEEGIFIDPVEARRAAGGVAESIVVINHRISSNPSTTPTRAGRVLVVDNTEALARLSGGAAGGTDVWNRVVAVFTTGQAWQFKSYPWTEARELFKHGALDSSRV